MTAAEDDYRYCGGDAAYQGAPGAFSEDAARSLVGADAALLPCRGFDDVFRAVSERRVRFGIVPVENSIAGPVPGVEALMGQHAVRVVGDVTLRIAQALIGLPGARVPQLARVYSHPVALDQCRRFLARHPHVAPVPAFDTAGAIADILTNADPANAAIGSERAAIDLGAVVLQREIQDRFDNFTRFVMVAAP